MLLLNKELTLKLPADEEFEELKKAIMIAPWTRLDFGGEEA